jgi:hypothetical protein
MISDVSSNVQDSAPRFQVPRNKGQFLKFVDLARKVMRLNGVMRVGNKELKFLIAYLKLDNRSIRSRYSLALYKVRGFGNEPCFNAGDCNLRRKGMIFELIGPGCVELGSIAIACGKDHPNSICIVQVRSRRNALGFVLGQSCF